MVDQNYPRGSCLIEVSEGRQKLACNVTLRHNKTKGYERQIKSLHLSRPEDYLSIYQSGCNHTCLKCHSHEFSKVSTGKWMSTDEIANVAKIYHADVTVFEPKEAATHWHANRLCRHCGSCVLYGTRPEECPAKLRPDQVVLSDLWILLETNGYGLTPKNLEAFAEGGIDAYWLDIKAYSEEVYRKLCGTTNAHILSSVEEIVNHGFTLEILTLYIPGIVETDEHMKLASLVAEVDPKIPMTLLAFFPCFKLQSPDYRAPTVQEMAESFSAMRKEGLENLRIGNKGVFLKTKEDLQYLVDIIGPDII
ncbi:MAG: radical SAM protein [Candidatus Thorarchaeota archaeon]